MKKLFFSLVIVAMTFTVTAQTVPPRSTYAMPGLTKGEQQVMNTMIPYAELWGSLTQSSTTAPVDTIQYNNLSASWGTPTITPTMRRVSTGLYNFVAAGCFGSDANKLKVTLSPTVFCNYKYSWLSADSFALSTSDTSFTVRDALVTKAGLHIVVFR